MKIFLLSLLAVVGVSIIFFPSATFAQTPPPTSHIINNPISADSPEELIIQIIQRVLGLLGIITVAAFIYGGLLMMLSGGSADMLKKAKTTLIWATLGLFVVLASYGILQYVFNFFQGVVT